MPIANQFDSDRFYIGSIEDHGLLPNNASYDPLPVMPWGRNWPQHVQDTGFVLVEDHRARPAEQFGESLAQGATAWWLPEDAYGTPAREAKTPGPLPVGALLKAPERSLSEARSAKAASIAAAYEAALAGAIALSDPTPSNVAIEAGLLAVSDPEGLEYVRNELAIQRDALLGAVDAAASAEAVQAIVVSYTV